MYPSNFAHNLKEKTFYYCDGAIQSKISYEVDHKRFYNISIQDHFPKELSGLRKIFILYAINELLKFDECIVELSNDEHGFIGDFLDEAGIRQRNIVWN